MNSLAATYRPEELINTNFSENNINYNSKSYNKNQTAFLTYIWEQFLILFEKEKGKKVINNWLKSLEILNWNNQKKIISIYAPNNFIKEWIETHFLQIIEKIFSRLLNEKKIEIQFILNTNKNINNNEEEKKFSNIIFKNNKNISHKNKNISSFFNQNINSLYNMENFLITQNNELVINAIQYFIDKNEAWNTILYIYGKTSIGKTHLLQGIRSLFLQKNILTGYINSNIFLKEYINAAKKKTISELENKFEEIDLLIFDDIEFLKNKKYTQEFLIKIINNFINTGKKIIFSGNTIPKNILGLSVNLCNQLEQGLIFKFENYSQTDIKNILELKIKNHNYLLPEIILNYILNIPNLSLNQYESIIHKIMAESIIKKEDLSLKLIENCLKELNILNNKNNNKDIHSIMDQISNYTQISIDQIIRGKTKSIIKIKYLSIYILRIIMKISCFDVAKYFEYKDHTTLSYACKTFNTLYKNTEEMTKILSLFN